VRDLVGIADDPAASIGEARLVGRKRNPEVAERAGAVAAMYSNDNLTST
jgi:hypothetical protein